MRKSKERLKIEALEVGERAEFPASLYLKVCRVVTVTNMTMRANGRIKPDQLMFSIDGRTKKNKVMVVRNI